MKHSNFKTEACFITMTIDKAAFDGSGRDTSIEHAYKINASYRKWKEKDKIIVLDQIFQIASKTCNKIQEILQLESQIFHIVSKQSGYEFHLLFFPII